jgi:hypothetical protein
LVLAAGLDAAQVQLAWLIARGGGDLRCDLGAECKEQEKGEEEGSVHC